MNAAIGPELAALAQAFDMTADELTDVARKAATAFHRMASNWRHFNTPDAVIQRQMRQIAKRHHITLPNKAGLQEQINRLSDPAWWKRALRKRFQVVEYAAIQSGAVHACAGKYVSDKTMARAIRNQRRIAELLESLVAVNQTTGEVRPMNELAEQSLSNPANQRKAFMARIKGIEQFAQTRGHEALFLTITCPSRMHARSVAGELNPRYDGTGPRQAQAHLNSVWRKANRKLGHCGAQLSGVRIAEPHHDGCPHWHVLMFVAPEHSALVVDTLRAYALNESPNEPGAAERRFKVERIDPARGSAVGYVAKYVSKNIDGEGVDRDEETGAPGKDSAPRVVAWARTWNVRQFQFFGVPPITPTRELYRLERLTVPSRGLKAAHVASKANDYGQWLHACDTYQLGFKATYAERKSSRYVDEMVQRLVGLTATACDLGLPAQLTTRVDEWRIEPRKVEDARGEVSPPWTRFNNCAPIEFIDFFPTATEVDERTRVARRMGEPRRTHQGIAAHRIHSKPIARTTQQRGIHDLSA
ncbi:MAG: replication endonuclease [Burkholderiaceae bacterium]|nr:replication endonuclease [Burkholderiaceae bacterium]